MLPERHAHICCVLLQLLQIILAGETSWAISPCVDELEEGSGGRGRWSLLCKLCYVNFTSLSLFVH